MKSISLFVLLLIATFNGYSQQSFYSNPVLSGFYPDPSICRVGNDYYLVNSSFSYFPGIPIFHSKDLVSWQLIGHAITRAEQMDFTGKGVSRSLFAPTIRYHDGLFYITCTMIDGGGNFIVTATNPAGPWSDPTWLAIDGIDPSLYFDDDGKTYITYNSIPPDNKSLYDGHRTIRIHAFDHRQMKLTGKDSILVNGGTDISKKPSWIEGPHIVKKYGYYYLISAEGGTGADHSVVAFRSRNIMGPYLPYEQNPILTQRHLQGQRQNPVTSTGHADLVELPDGRWYAVFLGTRPYEGDHYNTGRETFLTPVEWKDEWPVINPGREEVQYRYSLPFPQISPRKNISPYSGNFLYKDDFNESQLHPDWIFLRTVKESWYSTAAKKDWLQLQLRPETVGGKMNPSYIARRQQHSYFTAATMLRFSAKETNEKAGLLCFMNEGHFYFIALSTENQFPVVQLYQSSGNTADSNKMILVASQQLRKKTKDIWLTVDGNANTYRFSFSTGKHKTHILKEVDGKFLSTKTAGGFVGATVGPYATSLGKPSGNTAIFDWFFYRGNDPVHNQKTGHE